MCAGVYGNACSSKILSLLCAGVYGDVHRVKILFNKKENALVQMADATQAQLGVCFDLHVGDGVSVRINISTVDE